MKKAYIAGPLFTPAERNYLEEIDKIIRDCGYETYLPHRDAGIFIPGTDDSRKFFDKDMEELKKCDIVIAVLNGTDTDSGTAWEIGFAYSNNIKIYGILEDRRNKILNPMILNSIGVMAKSLDELKKILV